MSRRAEGQLFVGRLSKSTRARDLEDVFEPYGRMTRCEVKVGAEMGHGQRSGHAYAFVDFEDRRDAEDAIKYENGRDVAGSSIIVEWAKGNPRRPLVSRGYDECYRCHRPGHWARDCPDDRYYGFRRPSRGGGGGGGRYRSPSPRSRRRRSRSRSRSRERRRRTRSHSRSRSRSPSRDHRRRSRSRSRDRKHGSRKRSSLSKSRSRSKSKSKSSSKSRSRSKSPTPEQCNGDEREKSRSRSRSRSASKSASD